MSFSKKALLKCLGMKTGKKRLQTHQFKICQKRQTNVLWKNDGKVSIPEHATKKVNNCAKRSKI